MTQAGLFAFQSLSSVKHSLPRVCLTTRWLFGFALVYLSHVEQRVFALVGYGVRLYALVGKHYRLERQLVALDRKRSVLVLNLIL